MKKNLGKFILYLMIFSLLFSCASSREVTKESDTKFDPLYSIVKFYQGPLNHLSAVRRGECPMYPSCSEYSKECIKKHGMIIGWMMTCDRLMRCGRDETKLSPIIFVSGKWKYYDPVERNDFWWNKNKFQHE